MVFGAAAAAAVSSANGTPIACAMHLPAASLTAVLVTVAPVTASTSALCPLMIASLSFSAATSPKPCVSPAASMTTSVMLVSSKVMVTVTSPMPRTVAL